MYIFRLPVQCVCFLLGNAFIYFGSILAYIGEICDCFRSHSSSFGIVTKLQAARPKKCFSIPSKDKKLFSFPKVSRLPVSYSAS